jgi:hypothetical protein
MKCHGVNCYHIGDGQVGQANQSQVVPGLDDVTFNITEIKTARVGVKLQQNRLECLPFRLVFIFDEDLDPTLRGQQKLL